MDYLKTIVRGTGWKVFGEILNKIIRYVSIFLITHLISPTQYGLFTLGNTIIGILGIIALLGFENSLVKFITKYNAEKEYGKIKTLIKFVFKIILIWSLIISLLLFLMRNYISNYIFSEPNLSLVILIFSILIPLQAVINFLFIVLRSFKKVYENVLISSIVGGLAWLLLVFIAFFMDLSFFWILVAKIISKVAILLFAIYYVCKLYLKKFQKIKEEEIVKLKIVSFSFPLFLHSSVALIAFWADKIMLGIFGTAKDVGIYNIAIQLALLSTFILIGINEIFVPIIGELYHSKKMELYRGLFQSLTRWAFTFSMFILSFYLLFGKELLILFGKDYSLAFLPLIIITVAQAITVSAGPVGHSLIMLGKNKWVLYDTLFIVMINIILNLILIPKYGIIGVAIATAIAYICNALLWSLQNYYLTKTTTYNLAMLKPIIMFIVAITLGSLIKPLIMDFNIYFIVIFGFLAILLISACAFLITMNKEEQNLLMVLGRKIKTLF